MKAVIGTASIGMNYGISNQNNKFSKRNSEKLLSYCIKNKLSYFETSGSYGYAEDLLIKFSNKNNLKIIYKIPPISSETINDNDLSKIYINLNRTIKKFKKNSLKDLFLHSYSDLEKKGSEKLFNLLLNFKKNTQVQNIGVSLYDRNQVDSVLQNYDFDTIQIPFNILDNNFTKTNYLKKIKKRNIKIHARSIFLQGLLLMDPVKINPFFDKIKPNLLSFNRYASKRNISKSSLCFNFVNSIKEIDKLIIGINNISHIDEILKNLKLKKKYYRNINFNKNIDEKYTNPNKWILK